MMRSFLARRRVALGFLFGALVLYLARPSVESVVLGAIVATVGQAIRLWAAGHLEKSREVTVSGPYQFTRHPLYVGSSVMALGVAIGCRSWLVALLVATYMGTTIAAAIRSEEAFLRERFGNAYDEYASNRGPKATRQFSWDRARRNREYRAMTGLVLFLLLLLLKMAVA